GAERSAGDGGGAPPDGGEATGGASRRALGGGDEGQRGVGDAATRRQDSRHARPRVILENPRDLLHARGIGNARPAELVHTPGSHDGVEGHRPSNSPPRFRLRAKRFGETSPEPWRRRALAGTPTPLRSRGSLAV